MTGPERLVPFYPANFIAYKAGGLYEDRQDSTLSHSQGTSSFIPPGGVSTAGVGFPFNQLISQEKDPLPRLIVFAVMLAGVALACSRMRQLQFVIDRITPLGLAVPPTERGVLTLFREMPSVPVVARALKKAGGNRSWAAIDLKQQGHNVSRPWIVWVIKKARQGTRLFRYIETRGVCTPRRPAFEVPDQVFLEMLKVHGGNRLRVCRQLAKRYARKAAVGQRRLTYRFLVLLNYRIRHAGEASPYFVYRTIMGHRGRLLSVPIEQVARMLRRFPDRERAASAVGLSKGRLYRLIETREDLAQFRREVISDEVVIQALEISNRELPLAARILDKTTSWLRARIRFRPDDSLLRRRDIQALLRGD